MPKSIYSKSLKYYDLNSGSSSYTGSLVGYVGGSYRRVEEIDVSWDSGYLSEEECYLENNPFYSNTFVRTDGGSFINDGFSVGDSVVFARGVRIAYKVYNSSGFFYDAASNVNYIRTVTVNQVTDSYMVFNSTLNFTHLYDSFPSNYRDFYIESFFDAIVVGTTRQNGIKWEYGFNLSADRFNSDSIIDQTVTGFYNDNATGSTTFIPLNQNIKSNKFGSDSLVSTYNGESQKTFTIESVGSFDVSNAIKSYTLDHRFIIPPYKEDWRDDIINSTEPEEFLGVETIKYTRKITFYKEYELSTTAKSSVFDTEVSNVGFYSENFNGGENTYEVVSVSILDNNFDSIEQVDLAGCLMLVRIKSNNSQFWTSGQPNKYCVVQHLSMIDGANYANSSIEYNKSIAWDSKKATIQNGTFLDNTYSTGIIRKITTKPSSDPYYLDLEITLNYNSFNGRFPEVGEIYLLSVVLTNTDSTTVNLPIDINSYIKNTDISGLWYNDRFEIYDHPTDFDEEGYTSYKGWIEDGILLRSENRLAIGSVIDSMRVSLVAEGENSFEIDGYNIDLSETIVSNNAQQIEITESVGYNLSDADQFNTLSVTTTAVDSEFASYKMYIPFKLPWQSWQKLDLVDTVFYQNDPQSENGLNKKSSRYDGVNGYEVKIYLTLDIIYDGITTTYIDRTPAFTIEDEDNANGWTVSIDTFDSNDEDLSGGVLTNEETFITATFVKSSHGYSSGDLAGVIRLEEQRQSGDDIHELSTIRTSYSSNPLEPLTGSFATLTVEDSDTITIKCKINYTKIKDTQYRISARLFPDVSAPLSADYNDDYNNDYLTDEY